MLLPLMFFLALRAGAQPTDWAGVEGAPLVRYRWSRPAVNSCLIELQNDSPTESVQLSATASYLGNRPLPVVRATGPISTNGNATIVRQHVEQRSFRSKLNRLDRSATSFEDCYGIVHLRATITPVGPNLAPLNPDTEQEGHAPADPRKPQKPPK